MTILTGAACKAITYSAGATIPAAVGALIGIATVGARALVKNSPLIDPTGTVATGTMAALGGALGAGTSAGAIVGALVSKTYSGAIAGAIVGGLSSTSLGSVLAGSVGITTAGIVSGPLGLLCVGTSVEEQGGQLATYDCWKRVLHDESDEPSDGMLLKDLFLHPNISKVSVTGGSAVGSLPHIFLENVWNEMFQIEYVILPETNKLTCHATLC